MAGKLATFACATALLLGGAAPATAQDGNPATCLRQTAPGEVALLDELGDYSSTMHTIRDGAVTGKTTPGILDGCPEVDSGGDTTVIAGYARDRGDLTKTHLRAAVRERGGDFAAPVELQGRLYDAGGDVSVAVGPSGDTIVAWTQVRAPSPREFDEDNVQTSMRILAARRPAGGRFGPIEVVADWRKVTFAFAAIDVDAGVDDAGAATVAWTFGKPVAERFSDPEKVVLTRTAAAGSPFGEPHEIAGAPNAAPSGGVELEVTAQGRALVAWTSDFSVMYAERPSRAAGFGSAAPLIEANVQPGDSPAIALRDDGAALIAWKDYDEDGWRYKASRRQPGAEFGPPEVLAMHPEKQDLGAGSAFTYAVYGTVGGPAAAPLDYTPMRAAIGDDGSLLVTWIDYLEPDYVTNAFAARGSLSGGLGSARRIGSACRAVSGVVPLALSGATARVAWVDNASESLFFTFDYPHPPGRLHTTNLDEPDARGVAPRVTAHPPRRTLPLYADSAIKLPVECDGPCDVRAWIEARKDARYVPDGPAAGAAISIPAAGQRAELKLTNVFGEQIAPRDPGPVTVHLRTCDPATGTARTSSTTVRVRRRRAPAAPELYDVRARRVGPFILVSWKTVAPARRVVFDVHGTEMRVPDDYYREGAYARVEGNGETSFQARIKPPRRQSEVMITTFRIDRPARSRAVTVRVAG